jgi:type IV secretory pathway TrbF-like protein
MLDSGPERLSCNAYYTGGGSQLGMAIRCKSDSSSVEIRSKLSLSGSRLTGNWEERTFNAQGTATGTARPGRLAIRVTGSVTGSMIVNYSRTSQSVSIATQGIALKSVSINLTRS